MAKKRTTAPAAPSKVQNRDDLVSGLARLTELHQQRAAAVGEVDVQISVLQQGLGLVTAVIDEEMKSLQADIQRFAEVHRLELTDNSKVKTVSFATGDIGWRKDPPSVSVPKSQEPLLQVIDALDSLNAGLVRKVRLVDKEAILAVRASLAAVAEGTPEHAELNQLMEAIEAIARLKINAGDEKFWIKPKGLPGEPEHTGVPVEPVAETAEAQ